MIRVSCAAMAWALVLVSWCVPDAAAQSAGAIHAKRADIVDFNGFEKPLVASTILVPADWRVEGGVVWNAQGDTCGGGYNFDWRATAPDGLSGVQILPVERWQWSGLPAAPSMGCPAWQIASVQQYIEWFVQRARPEARILDFRRRPDIEKELERYNQRVPNSMGEVRTWVEAGEALLAYQQDGVAMRETVAFAVVFNSVRNEAMMGMPAMEYWGGTTLPGYAMRAPSGQLDLKLAEMIRKSVRGQPEWSARIAQHNNKIAGIHLKGARDRSRIIAKTGEEVLDMQMEGWRRRNESSDRMGRETSETIRGVETYNDPYHGGTVDLDNTYEHAWQLNDGTYVLTDDPSFEPFRQLGIDGRQLEAAQ